MKAGKGCVVLGAGLAGLSAAVTAGPRAQVFEAASRPGGECVTDQIQGYAFDRAGHLLHLQTPAMRQWAQCHLSKAWKQVARDARIHLLGDEVRYPIQANLFGLPTAVKAQCLRGYLEAMLHRRPDRPKNFLAWARAAFGEPLARIFFEPYNQKLWTRPPSELTLDWMGGYVPQPDLAHVLAGAFADQKQGGGYNARFWYPRRGGIEALARIWASRVPCLHLNARARSVNPRRRTVFIQGVGPVAYHHLISTVPLPALVAMLDDPPHSVRDAVRQLSATSMLVVNLGIARPQIHPAHWVYVPEPEYVFHRVGFPSNYGKVSPPGCSAISAEIALPAGTGWEQRQRLAQRVRRDLQKIGWLRPGDRVPVTHLQYIPYAYVIYDADYAAARRIILAYLEKQGIRSIGRWGAWEYSAMEDALLSGKNTAAQLKQNEKPG